MRWSPSVILIWGWEAEKETFDKPTDKIKYNEDTGEPYNVLEHSHECFMVEDVKVFEAEYVYEEDNLLDLSDDLSLGAFEVRKGVIWGVPSTKRLELEFEIFEQLNTCLLYTSPSPRDRQKSRMPSSA